MWPFSDLQKVTSEPKAEPRFWCSMCGDMMGGDWFKTCMNNTCAFYGLFVGVSFTVKPSEVSTKANRDRFFNAINPKSK